MFEHSSLPLGIALVQGPPVALPDPIRCIVLRLAASLEPTASWRLSSAREGRPTPVASDYARPLCVTHLPSNGAAPKGVQEGKIEPWVLKQVAEVRATFGFSELLPRYLP